MEIRKSAEAIVVCLCQMKGRIYHVGKTLEVCEHEEAARSELSTGIARI